MSYRVRNSDAGCGGMLGCWLFILILNLSLGTYCFGYSLMAIIGKTVPWGFALLGGLVLGELTIPLAIICWILKIAGVHAPFFHVG